MLLIQRRADGNSAIARAGLLSAGLHGLLLAILLGWFGRVPTAPDTAETNGAVELVLVEQKGAGVTTAPVEPPPPVVTPPSPSQPTPPPPDADATGETLPLPPPPVPPPSEQRQTPPPVRPAQEALDVNIGGNDSETNAIVTGPNVVPASPDAKFRNREPVYPVEAIRRAEQGSVILLIHVSSDGLPNGVDVAQSSGFAMLDRAARDAVTTWHSLPAIRDGHPIPFDMALRVVFHLD